MGMHFGVVATTGTVDELLAALSAFGSFRSGREIAAIEDVPEVDAAGEKTLVAGDHAGKAYLLDDSLLIVSSVDLLVDASRRLGRSVLTILGETTSGTYALIAAEDGQLVRLKWISLGALAEPYDLGAPLAGEAADGLDDVDGERLLAIHRAAGFDYGAWLNEGRKVIVDATYGEPVTGPDGDALNAYLEARIRPGMQDPEPVVAKRAEGFDLVAPGTRMPDGSRIGRKQQSGLFGRLFGRR